MKQLKDLKEEILKKEILNFYVFYGEDFGLRKHYINAIKLYFDRVVVLDDYKNLSNNKGFSLLKTKTLYIIYNCEEITKLSIEQINGFIKKIQDDCVILDFESSYEDSNLFSNFGSYITYFPTVNDNIGMEFVDSEVNLILNSKKSLAYSCYNNYNSILLETDKIKNYSQFTGINEEQAFEVLDRSNQFNIRYDNYDNDLLVNDILTNNRQRFGYWCNLIETKYQNEFWYNLYRTVNDFLIAYYVQKYGKYKGSSKAYELGLPWNRTKVIRELNICYDADDLLYYVGELTDIDFKVKTGKLVSEDVFNYFVFILLT